MGASYGEHEKYLQNVYDIGELTGWVALCFKHHTPEKQCATVVAESWLPVVAKQCSRLHLQLVQPATSGREWFYQSLGFQGTWYLTDFKSDYSVYAYY